MLLDLECTLSLSISTVTSNFISIGDLSALTGLSAHTLRFYEKAGVLLPVGRAANGHRRYRSEDMRWLEFVLRLKRTGMPLADIRQYAQLRAQGNRTLPTRLAMLQLHQERLVANMAELEHCASTLDDKIRTYRKMIAAAKRPTRKVSK